VNVRRFSLAVVLAWGLVPLRVTAAPLRQALELVEQIVKQTGRYSDDAVRVLVREADDAVEQLARHSDEAIARLLRSSEREEVEQLLDRRLKCLLRPDGAVTEAFRRLPLGERHLVLELGEAAQHLTTQYPEDAARVLTKLGSGGLAQARAYGSGVFDGAIWLASDDTLATLRAVRLTPDQGRAVQLALRLNGPVEALSDDSIVPLWRSALRRTRGGAAVFWRDYVEPHKGKWLVGTALVAYLAAPESFHDAAGRLTEYGARELARLGITSVVGTGTGLLDGARSALAEHWARSPTKTIATLVGIAVLILLSFPRSRVWLWRRVVNRKPCMARRLQGNNIASVAPSDIK